MLFPCQPKFRARLGMRLGFGETLEARTRTRRRPASGKRFPRSKMMRWPAGNTQQKQWEPASCNHELLKTHVFARPTKFPDERQLGITITTPPWPTQSIARALKTSVRSEAMLVRNQATKHTIQEHSHKLNTHEPPSCVSQSPPVIMSAVQMRNSSDTTCTT